MRSHLVAGGTCEHRKSGQFYVVGPVFQRWIGGERTIRFSCLGAVVTVWGGARAPCSWHGASGTGRPGGRARPWRGDAGCAPRQCGRVMAVLATEPGLGCLSVANTGGPEEFQALFQALDQFNAAVVGPADFRPLVVLLRDSDGAVTGGLWGRSCYGWLTIQMLFVPQALRGRRLGSAMVGAAAVEARARGCIGMQVDTFSFQARGFYERLGFSVMGVQEDLPPGHRCYYLTRRLDIVAH